MSGLDVATARLVPAAGAGGWLARVAHAVLFSADGPEEQLEELLDACEGGNSSAEVLGRVVALLSSGTGTTDRPPFALVATSGGNVVALVHGEATVVLEDVGGHQTKLSAGAGAWLTRTVPDTARVTLGEGPTAPTGLTDLRAGVIPAAGGALLEVAVSAPPREAVPGEAELAEVGPAAVAAAAGAPVPAPAPEEAPPGEPAAPLAEEEPARSMYEAPAPAEDARAAAAAGLVAPQPQPGAPDVELFDAEQEAPPSPAPSGYEPTGVVAAEGGEAAMAEAGSAPSDAPPGSPVVSGRFCGRLHFNDPRAQFCRVCGLALNPEATPEVSAPRPLLGVLVWDTGETDPVEGDVVVGRDPAGDPEVSSGHVGGLTPAGHSEGMSRVHAEIRLSGWDISLADRGSTNGTFVWEEDKQAWHRLETGERAPLQVGTIVAFGERTATFELPGGEG